jgi:hypothetical protein
VTRSPDVVLVHLDDCPHWRTADQRLREAMRLAGLDPAKLRYQRATAEHAPDDFPGSPAILVDGHDPFATAAGGGAACRRYQTETGPDGAPSVPQLVSILKGAQPRRRSRPR